MGISPTTAKKTMELANEIGSHLRSAEKKVSEVSSQPEKAVAKSISPELLAAYNGVTKTKFIKLLPDHANAGVDSLIKELGVSDAKGIKEALSLVGGSPEQNLKTLLEAFPRLGIKNKDLHEYTQMKCINESFENLEGMYSRSEFMRDLISDVSAHKSIRHLPMFSVYNLSLKDTSEINTILTEQYFNVDKIARVLEKKNPELFEQLGGYKHFNTNNAYEELAGLQSRLNGEQAVEGVIKKSDKYRTLEFEVNDAPREVLMIDNLAQGTTPVHQIGRKELEIAIKSNMFTTEMLNNPRVMEILKEKNFVKSENCKLPNGETEGVDFNCMELVEKLKNEGEQSLSSNEMHVITDSLKKVYLSLSEKEQRKLLSDFDRKLKMLYSKVRDMKDHLARTGKGEIVYCPKKGKTILSVKPKEAGLSTDGEDEYLLKYGNYIFENHFFMRMFDRDLANVADNSTGEILNLEKLMDRIVQTPHGELGEKGIKGLHGHGLEFETRTDGNIKVVDSIMQ